MGIEEINDERVDLESKLLKFLRFMWNPLSWVMEFAALMAIGLAIGSTCKHGEIHAVVIATGVHTFYGKAAHLFDNTNRVRHFQKVLTAIINFCICSIALGMIMEIIVKYPIQHRSYRDEIDNLLVLLIGGIPIAMPTVLSVTMDIGSHRLSTQGAITKRMTTIEEMTEMDVLCSDKSGTLTLNKLKVDKAMIKVFVKDMDQETVPLLAARASRVENQDAIDTCIVGMLADPKEIERLCRQSPEAAESFQAAKLQAVGVPPEHRVSDSAVERLSCRLARAERKLKKKDCRMRQQVAAMEVLRGDMSRLQAERDAAMTAEALLREQLAQQPVVSDVAVEAVLEEEEITPELVPVVVADAATVTSPSLDEQARLQADLNFREVEVYVLRTDLAESLQYGQRAAAEIQALIAQLATVDDHAIVKERDAQRNIISDLRSQLGRSQSAVADLEHRAATDAMMVDLRLKLYESETKERYSQMLAEERDAAAELRSRISYLEGELAGQYAYFESRSRFLSQSRAGSTRGFHRRCREPVPPFFEAGPFSSVPVSAAATPADALGAVTPAASDGSRRRCRNSVEGSGETDDAPSPKR